MIPFLYLTQMSIEYCTMLRYDLPSVQNQCYLQYIALLSTDCARQSVRIIHLAYVRVLGPIIAVTNITVRPLAVSLL